MGVQLDIERLRFDLSQSGMNSQDVFRICDDVTKEINEYIANLISNAITEAIDHALNIGADDFIDDIQVLEDSNGIYQISSRTGNLDYSQDPKEMLPHLLKNADINQHGDRYKIIPIQQKSNQVEHSMFSMMQKRQDLQDDARDALRDRAMSKRAGLVETINSNLAKQAFIAKTEREARNEKSGDVEFRTASSRQDASKSWVIPAKEADMTDFIKELNMTILQQSNDGIDSIINEYYSIYMER